MTNYSRTFRANGKWAKATKRDGAWVVVYGWAGDLNALAGRTIRGVSRTYAVISATNWINE